MPKAKYHKADYRGHAKEPKYRWQNSGPPSDRDYYWAGFQVWRAACDQSCARCGTMIVEGTDFIRPGGQTCCPACAPFHPSPIALVDGQRVLRVAGLHADCWECPASEVDTGLPPPAPIRSPLLAALTRDGELTPTHFRWWAADLEREKGYTPMLAQWLRDVADAVAETQEQSTP